MINPRSGKNHRFRSGREPFRETFEQHFAQSFRIGCATGLTCCYTFEATRAQALNETSDLRRFPRTLAAFKCDEMSVLAQNAISDSLPPRN